jgi:altered-inheritance-of-mitochondria protein 5
MGFPTGFVSRLTPYPPRHTHTHTHTHTNNPQLAGVTLTTSTLYLLSYTHSQTRARQSALLSTQNSLLTNVLDPSAPAPPASARPVQAGVLEQAKDRWNREVEGLARRLFDTDWTKVGHDLESRVGSVVERVVDSGKRLGAEATEKAKEVVSEGKAPAVVFASGREG